MQIRDDFIDLAKRMGTGLLDAIIVADDLHLAPTYLRPGAAARVRAGIRRIEVYLRRLILLLALQIEHALPPCAISPVRLASAGRPSASARLTIFARPGQLLALTRLAARPRSAKTAGDVAAYRLLLRLAQLGELLEAPRKRARRLAWNLARRRAGFFEAPGRGYAIASRFGTEASAIFDAMAELILGASLSRPPQRGLAPRPPPRIRTL